MIRPISVIIPVYRDAAPLQRRLRQLMRPAVSRTVELIVVDGEENGGTLRAIRANGLKSVRAPRGRGIQMNRGAAIASGNIFLFLHADTLLPEGAPQAILEACKPPHIAGGAFTLGIDAPGKAFRVIEALVRLRTRLTRIPYGDQGIFIKKSVFHEVGGYPEIPIMEDVALMERMKHRGKKIALLPASVTTSARRWKKEGLVYCSLRNRILMLLFAAGMSPRRLARFYP